MDIKQTIEELNTEEFQAVARVLNFINSCGACCCQALKEVNAALLENAQDRLS